MAGSVDFPEVAAQENLAVSLHGDAIHGAENVGVETGVQTAITVESCNVVVRSAVDHREAASHDDPAIALQSQARDGAAVRSAADAGGETLLQAAVGVESRDPAAWDAVHLAEITRKNELAVRLHDQVGHASIHADVETWVHAAGLRVAARRRGAGQKAG